MMATNTNRNSVLWSGVCFSDETMDIIVNSLGEHRLLIRSPYEVFTVDLCNCVDDLINACKRIVQTDSRTQIFFKLNSADNGEYLRGSLTNLGLGSLYLLRFGDSNSAPEVRLTCNVLAMFALRLRSLSLQTLPEAANI